MLLSDGFMPNRVTRRALLVFLSLVSLAGAPMSARTEVRALWVVRTSLTSPAAIEAMVASARAGGFNTVLVQIRGRGDAYYADGIESRPAALTSQPAFDPLATVIARAHDADIEVHAWINVNLVADGNDLPAARTHVLYRHPEWLMVPRALADDLAEVDPRSPEYLGRLARYVRAQAATIEGLYVSPVTAAATEYTAAVVRDIVQRYAVDGVHFDYMRYPSDDFDYSRSALTAFRLSVIGDLTLADQRRYDERLQTEPLIYTQAFPERWHAFRTARMTALAARLREAVRAARPSALVSAAVGPDPAEAASRRLQDWSRWVAQDLIDVVCPMAYTTDSAVFASQIAAAGDVAGTQRLWAGIGAYRLSRDQILDNIQTARRLGVGGIVLFSYDSLTAPTQGSASLSQLGRAF